MTAGPIPGHFGATDRGGGATNGYSPARPAQRDSVSSPPSRFE